MCLFDLILSLIGNYVKFYFDMSDDFQSISPLGLGDELLEESALDSALNSHPFHRVFLLRSPCKQCRCFPSNAPAPLQPCRSLPGRDCALAKFGLPGKC